MSISLGNVFVLMSDYSFNYDFVQACGVHKTDCSMARIVDLIIPPKPLKQGLPNSVSETVIRVRRRLPAVQLHNQILAALVIEPLDERENPLAFRVCSQDIKPLVVSYLRSEGP